MKRNNISPIHYTVGRAKLLAREYITKKLELGDLNINGRQCELTYYKGCRKYKVLFKMSRGPCSIEGAFCDGENVMEQLIQALGPGKNFHNIPTTPRMLGYDNLTVKYRSGSVVNYESSDVIEL